jgi:hypothetical protein
MARELFDEISKQKSPPLKGIVQRDYRAKFLFIVLAPHRTLTQILNVFICIPRDQQLISAINDTMSLGCAL